MIQDIKACILEAQHAVSDLPDEYRLIAFQIILSRLLDRESGSKNKTDATIREDSGESDSIPVISPTNSTINNVRTLFATEWGKGRRSYQEISKALDANGVPDPKHLSTMLGRLIQSKELLRIKQVNGFVYWKNPAGEGGA